MSQKNKICLTFNAKRVIVLNTKIDLHKKYEVKFHDILSGVTVGFCGVEKQLIKNTREEPEKERRRHILIYNFKVYLVVAFCFAFRDSLQYDFWFGKQYCRCCCIAGIACAASGGFWDSDNPLDCYRLPVYFLILMVGPRFTNMIPAGWAFLVNIVCILLLMILGCHNVIMSNHSTFVLSLFAASGL